MKVFHELAYEGFVLADGTGVGLLVSSDPRLMELIGAVDVAHVSGYSAQVTGTSPQLTIWIDYSNDRSYFGQPDAVNRSSITSPCPSAAKPGSIPCGAPAERLWAAGDTRDRDERARPSADLGYRSRSLAALGGDVARHRSG